MSPGKLMVSASSAEARKVLIGPTEDPVVIVAADFLPLSLGAASHARRVRRWWIDAIVHDVDVGVDGGVLELYRELKRAREDRKATNGKLKIASCIRVPR